MTFYPDLSRYEYMAREISASVLNVGWLGIESPYHTGAIDEESLQRLVRHYENRVNRTRGFHYCPFCIEAKFGLAVNLGDREIILGGAEIRVSDEQGVTYAAPDLIYHYITDHQYKPPDEFLRAL